MKNIRYAYILKLCFIILFTAFVAMPVSAAKKKKSSEKNKTRTEEAKYFVNFDEADYRTSPDKRIGAKILVDPNSIGPSIASLINLTYLPGAHVTSHKHVYSSEIIYVLNGVLTVKVDGIIKNVTPNSSVFIPAGSFHEYLNDSSDVVQFIQFYSPAAPEEEYRKWENPVEAEEREAKEKEKAKEAEVETIITPEMPTVPGSPRTRIGEVKTPQKTDVEALRERIRKALEQDEIKQ